VEKLKISTRKITIIGMLGAISIFLGMTPLGIIPIPFSPARATIMHIPVIIGSVLEGPVVGLFVGFIFGAFSMYQGFTQPGPTNFVFMDPLVAILPRILIALTSYYSYRWVKTWVAGYQKFDSIPTIVGAAIGTLTNTVGVLFMIYIRHGREFASAINIDYNAVKGVIAGIALTNGLPEVIVGVIIVTAVIRSVLKLRKNE
jgi:uncharacterized membrane protein